jgi:hypothetical protein
MNSSSAVFAFAAAYFWFEASTDFVPGPKYLRGKKHAGRGWRSLGRAVPIGGFPIETAVDDKERVIDVVGTMGVSSMWNAKAAGCACAAAVLQGVGVIAGMPS